jgi:hypothetical protein
LLNFDCFYFFLAVYNKRVKKFKVNLKEITTANKFKKDVWKQYNNILASEEFIMKELGKIESNGDEDDEDEDDEDEDEDDEDEDDED